MKRYDPDRAPDPKEWLQLGERERIRLVERYHQLARIELPKAKLHATFHVVVENQIAENLEPVVRTMARLQAEGLTRHDALHAVGSVLAEHIYDLLSTSAGGDATTTQSRYEAAVERLDAKSWLRGSESE